MIIRYRIFGLIADFATNWEQWVDNSQQQELQPPQEERQPQQHQLVQNTYGSMVNKDERRFLEDWVDSLDAVPRKINRILNMYFVNRSIKNEVQDVISLEKVFISESNS